MNIYRKRKHSQDKTQNGSSLVEYSLLVSLISVVVLGSVRSLGHQVDCTLINAGNALSSPVVQEDGSTTQAIRICARLYVSVEMIPNFVTETAGTGGFAG